ncbi:MAG TPA: LuxR C-terminal-related transcriptional regulator [Rubrobacter sp.]|nr:LuxR C-terminal-related transcriptional regulator [Rubrobacter sp.]
MTLTGPGGAGKTRLALAIASETAGAFEDGVWLVELAPLSDPELVPQAVASVVGVRESPGKALADTLAEHLGTRDLLLLLDNCEHLADACVSLADRLLRRCPNLRILATSREALGIAGESLFDVPPLSLPDPHRGPTAGSLPEYEAVRLFVERARAVRPGFALTEENSLAIAHVCYRLDGIPLALELAAARAKVLSVEQISERLDDSFALLTGGGRTRIPHHKTLRAAMDWSYDLLTGQEQTFLARLSVFAGGFALEAAEAVGTGEDIDRYEALDLLASLVDRSLVLVAEHDGEARYRLLETVRQYGRGKLEGLGEADQTLRRHAGFYLALAESVDLMSREQAVWLERLEIEHDNFRAALVLSLGEDAASKEDVRSGLRLAVALWPFWYTRGYLSEGRGWLESAVARGGSEDSSAKAAALNGAGYITLFQGDYGAARALLEQSLALYRELGDDEGVASSLIYLGFVAVLSLQDLETVPTLEEEAVGLRPRLADPLVLANLHLLSGLVALNEGDLERAVVLHRESLAMFRDIHDARGMGHCFNNLGFLALLQDNHEEAAALLRENLRLARQSGYKLAIQYSFLGLGFVADSWDDPLRAARLWGATETMEETFGIEITPIARSAMNFEARVSLARSNAGETAFETARSEGRAMSPEQAIEYALQEPEPPESVEPSPAYPLGLSAREVEVLKLAAEGLTNAQIASKLFISPRTVNAHLGSIYHKIGSSTRAQAARFAAEQGLL